MLRPAIEQLLQAAKNTLATPPTAHYAIQQRARAMP
ncbi:Hypothetical protein AJF4211_000010 [Avibacterium paragallinarum JF4211]|nr:Hypothetical protein AJF4211_000010 [Avibacterium paragallinarum JF4211]